MQPAEAGFPTAVRPRPGLLVELHGLRALAILSVLLSHHYTGYYFLAGAEAVQDLPNRLAQCLHELLWHDSTLYFALLSGLLCSRLHLHRQGWRAFWLRRLQTLFLPYLLLSAVFTVRGLWLQGLPLDADTLLSRYLHNVWSGQSLFMFWYFPVLFCLLLLTPCLYRLAQSSPWLLAVCVLLPLLVSRTGVVFSWQSVVYMGGAYAAGLYVGLHYTPCLAWARQQRGWLTAAALGVSAALAGLLWFDLGRSGLVAWQESVFYVQKLLLAAACLAWLAGYGLRLPAWLDYVAHRAFALYLVHWLFGGPLLRLMLAWWPPAQPAWWVTLQCLLAMALTLGLSLLLIALVQRLAGARSRYLVGA